MQLLFFLEFGKHGLGLLTVLYVLLSGFLIVQAIIKRNKNQQYVGDGANQRQLKDQPKQPIYKIATFKMWIILTIIAIIIHFAIQASY